MKTFIKLVMLSAILVVFVPAQAAVLVYDKTVKCWEAAEGEGWEVTQDTVRGYLVLEVVYDENNQIDEILYAYQVEYYINDIGEKEYSEEEHNFDVERVVDGNRVTWVLVESNSGEGSDEILMLRGRARNVRIGNGDPNEVARDLDGNHLAYQTGEGDQLQMCDLDLRLDRSLTRSYNRDGFDAFDALDDIENWLEARGYNPEER